MAFLAAVRSILNKYRSLFSVTAVIWPKYKTVHDNGILYPSTLIRTECTSSQNGFSFPQLQKICVWCAFKQTHCLQQGWCVEDVLLRILCVTKKKNVPNFSSETPSIGVNLWRYVGFHTYHTILLMKFPHLICFPTLISDIMLNCLYIP